MIEMYDETPKKVQDIHEMFDLFMDGIDEIHDAKGDDRVDALLILLPPTGGNTVMTNLSSANAVRVLSKALSHCMEAHQEISGEKLEMEYDA
jgi:hypothetical protein